MSKVIGDEPCPQCRSNGRDKTGNHLMIFKDGNKYCNRCGYSEKPGNVNTFIDRQEQKVNAYMDNFSSIQQYKPLGIPSRGITRETCEKFGVLSSCNEATGEIDTVYYPITLKGEVVAYKRRKLPKDFMVIGKQSMKGVPVELFGQKDAQRGAKKLLIVGGQDDWLAASQMLSQWNQQVVSVTNGENINSISDNLDFINSFSEVILCFDSDDAGKKLTEQAVKLIGLDTRVMKISEKDPNDMLLKNKEKEFVSAYFQAQEYTPDSIVIGGIGLDILTTPTEKGVEIPVFPNTMQKLKGFRSGEVTLVLAPAGVGKTTIMKEIGYALNKAGKSICHIFLEEDIKKTQQSYIAIDNNVSLARFRENPGILPSGKIEESYNELINNGRTMWIDHWGSIKPDRVIETFRFAASKGYEYSLLDHISMVFSGSETTNERKDIDMLLTKTAAFAKESGMHIIIVSHIKRQDRRWKPKEYPYWETVASDAGRGSGAFEQLAHNIITLEVQFIDEDLNKGLIRTRVAKNREWSVLGVGDILEYNYETGRISPVRRDY